MTMTVPDPLPLRWIQVPADVTRVDGCTCGGLGFHEIPAQGKPGCALFRMPSEQARSAVYAAQDRVAAFTEALNDQLRTGVVSDTVAVRFIGGSYDGQTRQVDAYDGVPPLRVAMTTVSGIEHYRHTGRMRNAPGEPPAHEFVIEVELTQADLDTARPITAERMQELRAGSEPLRRDVPLAVGDVADDAPPPDPVIVATANTFRHLAEWFGSKKQRAELYEMAEAAEALTPENDMTCPVCQETECDEGCPLAPVRNRWREVPIAKEVAGRLHVGPASLLNTETGQHVEPLAADLTPFLDWPLYFPDEAGPYCNNLPACKHEDCNTPCYGPVYLHSARRMTIREFLTDIKAHAEGAS